MRRIALRASALQRFFRPAPQGWAAVERTTCAATPSPWRWERRPLLIRSISRAPGTVTPGTTVPRGGRVVYLDAVPVASKHGRDPHERGPRPYHRIGCPQGPAPSRRRGQPALGGRRGTTTPVRRAALQRVGAFPPVPAGRRTLDRHRRTSRRGTGHHPPRLTLERPQPRGLPRVTAPAPGPFPSATSPPRPSGETLPELRTRAGSYPYKTCL